MHANQQTEWYWLAIRRSAVVPYPCPASISQIQKATIMVGEAGEQTLFANLPAPVPGICSNYDYLLGFPNGSERQRVQEILLNAPMHEVETELRRIGKDLTVQKVLGDGVRATVWPSPELN